MDESPRLRPSTSTNALDTPPEPNFDRITSLAATIFGFPVCVLSFTDSHHHWFKSRLDVDGLEMPRQMSFCDAAVSGETVFVVPDAGRDARFANAPEVAGPPHFRFCAGAPLIVAGGPPIGSLCLLDTYPHPDFDARSQTILAELAEMVVELLEARSRQIELANLTRESAYLARHDPLTGLPNRRQLGDHLGAALAGMASEDEIAVLYIDLDRFKEINDRFGHHVGDTLLLTVSERLRANVRAGDKIVRLGGDEFAVVQTGSHAQNQAADLAERLIGKLSEPYQVDGLVLTIGASIGIALGGKSTTDPEGLVKDADAALYRAKAAGRGRYHFYDGSLCMRTRNAG